VIIGSTYGRELVPLATKFHELNKAVTVIGVDLSAKAIEACKLYPLNNSEFYVLDIEDEQAVMGYINSALSRFARVGFYMCETAPYVLPEKLEYFFKIVAGYENTHAVQILEPAFIDWGSKYECGMIFSFQQDFWRHNYIKLISRYFDVQNNFFVDASIRSDGNRNQPLWLVSGTKKQQ